MAPVGHAVSTSAGLSLARSACSAGDWGVVFFGGVKKTRVFSMGFVFYFFEQVKGFPERSNLGILDQCFSGWEV